MIKYENNMLVLDSSHTKDDQDAVNKFIDTIREQERVAILKWIDKHRTYSELEAGIGIYRDHFTADDLVSFIREMK
jgi:hypothetical protein